MLVAPRKVWKLGSDSGLEMRWVDHLLDSLLLLGDEVRQGLSQRSLAAALPQDLQIVPVHKVLHDGVQVEEALQAGVQVARVAQVSEATEPVSVLGRRNGHCLLTVHGLKGASLLATALLGEGLGCLARRRARPLRLSQPGLGAPGGGGIVQHVRLIDLAGGAPGVGGVRMEDPCGNFGSRGEALGIATAGAGWAKGVRGGAGQGIGSEGPRDGALGWHPGQWRPLGREVGG